MSFITQSPLPGWKAGLNKMNYEIEPKYVWRKAKDIAFVDKVIHEKNKDPWLAIASMVDYWKKSNPTQWRELKIDIKMTKDTRANEFGASTNKNSGMRYTMSLPEGIWNMIVVIFGDKQILDPYSKKFFREFGKRFPEFRVSERS